MPRVHHVKKARKDNEVCKKGEEYFWWKNKTSATTSVVRKSKTYPRPSQLTLNPYYSEVYSIQEEIEDQGEVVDQPAAENMVSALEAAKDRLEELQQEQDEKFSTMEESFPNGCPSMEILEQRRDALEMLVDEIDSAISDIEGIEWPDRDDDEEPDEEDESCIDQAQSALESIGWCFE